MNAAVRPPVVAIDGPAASGKSSVALALAGRLRLGLMDSGSMYRAVALLACEREVPFDDEQTLTEIARSVRDGFRLELPPGGTPEIYLGDREISEAIRSPEVCGAVSPVSAVDGVRREMVSLQRHLASGAWTVVEGRDIGTVVFADAPLKVFLDASFEERVRRRYRELSERGMDVTRSAVASEIETRDRIDSSRENSPLSVAPDAVLIDTTNMSITEVVDQISEIWRSRELE